MDGQRFDQLARHLASAASRRQVLKSLAASFAASVLGASGSSAQGNGGNSDCAHFCNAVFGPGRARGRCKSDAAQGQGLCPACGADASRVCVAPDGAASCPDRSTDPVNCGACNEVCPSGVCVAGACLKANGEACGGGGECLSTFCVDGVCCDGACGGQCEACDATGACVPVSGSPVGGRAACASDGPVCGGACDGTTRAACAYPGATVTCSGAVCREGDAVSFACNGAGSCAESTDECGLFVCRDGACLDACADHDDCLGIAYCAGGVCTSDKGQGQACGGRDECGSGVCVDGVCCDLPCTGQCEACDVAGSVGTCSPAPAGAPRGNRQACSGTGDCAGTCNGVSADCVFPGAETACGLATCDGATLIAARICDGAGACATGAETDCSPYFCRDGACLETCDDPEDCASGYCVDGACCAGEDYCPFGEVCCDPDRPPSQTCCPSRTGGDPCCECFYRSDPGNEGFECCPEEKLCRSLTNSPAADTCCHDDEVCVNGDCCWTGKACEGGCCQTQCCNGACCASGEECVVAPGAGAESCQPVRACTADAQCNTAAGESCAEYDGVCCPGGRQIFIEVDIDGVPTTLELCCPYGQGPNVFDDRTCCAEPDRCGTSRGGFGRA